MWVTRSIVGKVSANCAMWPPIVGFFSTKTTGKPAFAMSNAARIPAIPPPMIKAFL